MSLDRDIDAWLRALGRGTRLGVLGPARAGDRRPTRARSIDWIELGGRAAVRAEERATLDAGLAIGVECTPAWPARLARLHARLRPRAPVLLAARPARERRLHTFLEACGFERIEPHAGAPGLWLARRRATLPDFVRGDLLVLICGLNPSLHSARSGIPFSRAGNRFWPAARAARLVSLDRDPFAALERGIGFTDLCKRPTRSASELSTAEYARGLAELERKLRSLRPRALCFVGLAGWRALVDRRAQPGWIRGGWSGRPAYLMPSTSGLNARSSLADLSRHLARVYHAARRGAGRHTKV